MALSTFRLITVQSTRSLISRPYLLDGAHYRKVPHFALLMPRENLSLLTDNWAVISLDSSEMLAGKFLKFFISLVWGFYEAQIRKKRYLSLQNTLHLTTL